MSSPALSKSSLASPPATTNVASDLESPSKNSAAVKPCCVCKDEKAARDECMLLSTGPDPVQECSGMVERYRSCMKGFGFNVG